MKGSRAQSSLTTSLKKSVLGVRRGAGSLGKGNVQADPFSQGPPPATLFLKNALYCSAPPATLQAPPTCHQAPLLLFRLQVSRAGLLACKPKSLVLTAVAVLELEINWTCAVGATLWACSFLCRCLPCPDLPNPPSSNVTSAVRFIPGLTPDPKVGPNGPSKTVSLLVLIR